MFTNEQIRKYMGGLVEKVGEDHTSYGRYSNPMTGKGACFLGALCEFMGFKVPEEGISAGHVLGKNVVSPEMSVAFGVAQSINDYRMEWKYVLMGVDLALEGLRKSQYQPCPCGCGLTGDVQGVVNQVRSRRALDKNAEYEARAISPSLSAPLWATGGIVTGTFPSIEKYPTSFTSASLTGPFSGMSVSVTSSTEAIEKAIALLNGQMAALPKQKDHALVA
jgi:hypothetical protein